MLGFGAISGHGIEAARLMNRLELVYTPKHGSWLNMAEPELSGGVAGRKALRRPVDARTEPQ